MAELGVVRRFHPSPVNEEQARPIQIAFSESHSAGIPDGESLPTEILARFAFDPLRTHSIPAATLQLRDLPPLLLSLSYAANTGDISIIISQRNRELLHLGNFALTTNNYLGIPLSEDSYLHVHINRDVPNEPINA